MHTQQNLQRLFIHISYFPVVKEATINEEQFVLMDIALLQACRSCNSLITPNASAGNSLRNLGPAKLLQHPHVLIFKQLS